MKLTINEELINKRLDEALFASGLFISRNKAKEAIDQGRVFGPRNKIKASDKVALNEVYEIAEMQQESHLAGEDIPLDVIYEDDDILIINKPAGLLVHPGNGHADGTLANALIHRGITVGDISRPGIVHRIDKDTSGLLAIAKTEVAFSSLAKQLEDHSMHREYLALVLGIITEDDAKIDAPIGRDKRERTKLCVDLNGKEAVTFFHVKQRYPEDNATLVDCTLLTGRTHQIRVHMEYIGHPVIGDLTYGRGNRKLYDQGQLLHAYRLTLMHPTKQKEVSFEAPLPAYFQDILKRLK